MSLLKKMENTGDQERIGGGSVCDMRPLFLLAMSFFNSVNLELTSKFSADEKLCNFHFTKKKDYSASISLINF